MKKIGLIDIKIALKDHRFRESLPESLTNDVNKYLQNPGCSCNLKFYKKLLSEASQQLMDYFPKRDIEESLENEEVSLNLNDKKVWEVINCNIHDLESKLKSIPPGKKQLAVARYEDQVTVIIL